MRIKEFVRKKEGTMKEVDVKDRLKEMRKEHDKLVKGRFEFPDANAGYIEFPYRFFPEDLLVTYRFTHGEVCEVPMGLIKHINNTVKKVRTFSTGALTKRGIPSTFETESRIRFIPEGMF